MDSVAAFLERSWQRQADREAKHQQDAAGALDAQSEARGQARQRQVEAEQEAQLRWGRKRDVLQSRVADAQTLLNAAIGRMTAAWESGDDAQALSAALEATAAERVLAHARFVLNAHQELLRRR